MERHFDVELKKLHELLLQMSEIVQNAIKKSVKSLVDRNMELAEEVISEDHKINMTEIEIDDFCSRLLALHQPTAVDLRFIISTMKINADLERIGDQAVNIAQRAQMLIKQPILKPLVDIPRMAELTQQMVKDVVTALINKDVDLARNVCERDDEIDDLNDQVFRELLTYMMQDAKNIERAVELILVSRHLERIADHATNIAENVIYYVKGETIKHHFDEIIKEKLTKNHTEG